MYQKVLEQFSFSLHYFELFRMDWIERINLFHTTKTAKQKPCHAMVIGVESNFAAVAWFGSRIKNPEKKF